MYSWRFLIANVHDVCTIDIVLDLWCAQCHHLVKRIQSNWHLLIPWRNVSIIIKSACDIEPTEKLKTKIWGLAILCSRPDVLLFSVSTWNTSEALNQTCCRDQLAIGELLFNQQMCRGIKCSPFPVPHLTFSLSWKLFGKQIQFSIWTLSTCIQSVAPLEK